MIYLVGISVGWIQDNDIVFVVRGKALLYKPHMRTLEHV